MNVQVLQVMPTKEYRVYVYFSDGRVKLFDASYLKDRGVFKKLEDMDFFMGRCTVLNGTLAWDLSGEFNPADCMDIDPETLYEKSVEVKDPLTGAA